MTNSKKSVFKLAASCTLLISFSSNALIQDSPKSSVKKIIAYSNLEGGSIVIELEHNGHTCSSGYWLSKNDQGFEITYTMLIDAFRSDEKNIMIQGNSLRSWPGSLRMDYCHIASVQYSR